MAKLLTTRLSTAFGLRSPIVSAPMAGVSVELAAAVGEAGGLGLYGIGYAGEEEISTAFDRLQNCNNVGVGFITWWLAKHPFQLTCALQRKPKYVMLSFGDPSEFGPQIKAAGATLICQCQSLEHVSAAMSVGADVIVAQGSEAGGHGASRGTMSFVAEVADYLAATNPKTMLLAAGGIADGRGLSAALMLGADGALLGSRFWASKESGAKSGLVDAAITANGDSTVQTNIPDIARDLAWPCKFRTLNMGVVRDWVDREEELAADPQLKKGLVDRYAKGSANGDPTHTAVPCGEAAGLIKDRPSAGELVERIAVGAAKRLSVAQQFVSE